MSRHRTSASPRSSKRSAKERRKGHAAKTNWFGIGLGGVGIVVVLLLLWLRTTARVATEITASQAYEKLQAQAFFLDVRGEADWNAGHIPGSVDIPLDELAGRLGDLPADREIVVVCTIGKRSKDGARILVEAGFWPVACLGGGLREWVAAGYPLETAAP
jgi:rhodanese-related sulfurtransferase